MSRALNADYHAIVVSSNRLNRYWTSILRTIRLVIEAKPELLFVQNPSLVLATLAIELRRFSKFKLIMDAHNAGLYPTDGKSKFLQWLADRVIRQADLVIVTNLELAKHVQRIGGQSFILPDPLPNFDRASIPQITESDYSTFKVVAICSWTEDEPIKEILNAARHFSNDTRLYCTGHPPKWAKKLVDEELGNVKLTGYLGERDYIELITDANCIVDLSTRENCLVCGAYEATAVGTPFIISDTEVSRQLFSSAAVFTHNSSVNILRAIDDIRSNEKVIRSNIIQFSDSYTVMWQAKLQDFEQELFGITQA